MKDLGEFPKAVAFEPDLGDEWVWSVEYSGHFWALGR